MVNTNFISISLFVTRHAVNVYCDKMDTASPREYITLKAGEENNFSTEDFKGSVKEANLPSSTASFSKVNSVSPKKSNRSFAMR